MKNLLKTPRFIGKKKPARRTPTTRNPSRHLSRRCSFERMEAREMLAADFLAGPGDNLGQPGGQPGGPTGTVSGSVFVAQSNNCGPHSQSLSLGGVRILLTDISGNVILETVTAADGSYDFPDLIPGKYSIIQVPPKGYLGTQAHIGGGGGLSLNANQVDNVEVEAGLTAQGYDFCDLDLKSFNAGIQAAAQSLAVVQSLPTSFQPLAEANSAFNFSGSRVVASLAPVAVVPPKPFVGSPQQEPVQLPETAREWGESPLDSEISADSFFEMASTSQRSTITLESLLGESEEPDESTGRNHDALFAGGYTVQSLEWWDEETLLDIGQVMGAAETVHLEGEPAEATPVATAKSPTQRVSQRTAPTSKIQLR